MRDTEEIKEFTLEVIEQYSEKYAGRNAVNLVYIIMKINDGVALDKEETLWLEDILSEQLKDDMIKALKKNGSSLILEADVQSNYPEAWAQYCRDVRGV